MRVLLVEDDTMIGEVVRDTLKDESYAVDWIQNGLAVASTLKAQPYDLILLDLGLPGKDGQEVIHNVLETVLPLAEAKHIDIGVTGDDNLEVPVSELNLTTLIRNLTDNAIRYTPEGGRVDLLVTATPDAIMLSVSDSGPGVSATERDHIFEPFYRVLGTGQAGSSLGLSIVAAIVHKIGARIELNNADETTQTGLRVTLTIPINGPLKKPGNEPC